MKWWFKRKPKPKLPRDIDMSSGDTFRLDYVGRSGKHIASASFVARNAVTITGEQLLAMRQKTYFSHLNECIGYHMYNCLALPAELTGTSGEVTVPLIWTMMDDTEKTILEILQEAR